MWATAVTDLRNLLSDNSTDHLRHRKQVLGLVDGVNTIFKTLENRRLTDFTASGTTVGVFQGNTPLTVTADDLSIGQFTVNPAPSDNHQALTATYYYQWFLDTEIVIFLGSAGQWLGGSNDYTQIAPGLQPAALHFAAQEGYTKLAIRWAERWSETYQLQDAPANEKSPVEQYLKLAQEMRTKAEELRKGFYTRQDQPFAPNFQNISGSVRSITPIR